MRRRILLCLLVLLLCAAPAFAEEPSAAERGLEAIKATRNWDYIFLPKEESYLEEWKTLYGRRAWYAPSLYVESMPLANSGAPLRPNLFEGTKVTVVAEEGNMSCILYQDVDYEVYAGWIQSIRLLEDFPGKRGEIGEPREGDWDRIGEVQERWSGCWLPTTEQPYTVLCETVRSCVGFTLDYQLIDEHTSLKWMLWGPRSVWVSDGRDWTPVGAFPYEENGTVRVQVWLPEPMDIEAIATVAHCYAPNIFDFRQTAYDFLVEKPS